MIYAKIYFGEKEDETTKTTHRVVIDVNFFGQTKILTEAHSKELVEIEDELTKLSATALFNFLAENDFIPISENFFYKK
jgi:hypothetical protein